MLNVQEPKVEQVYQIKKCFILVEMVLWELLNLIY